MTDTQIILHVVALICLLAWVPYLGYELFAYLFATIRDE